MGNSDATAWQAGAVLAFQMLREIQGGSFEAMMYEDSYRDGRPQQNVVAAYFAKLRDLQDTRCEAGFASILTDYLAMNMHAGEPDITVTSRRYTRPIASSSRGAPHG
jgi:hypothetical protein